MPDQPSIPAPVQLLTLHRFQKTATVDMFRDIFGANGDRFYLEFASTCRRNLLHWFEYYCPYKLQGTFLAYVFAQNSND